MDAYWPELSLVVELDGRGNHGTAAQKRRDATDARTLRANGLTVIRFGWDDVHTQQTQLLRVLAANGVCRGTR